jgi:tetratricopeptide (TPR) repeat protein
MYECKVCGLLSLGGDACPACGSQIRTDLSVDDQDNSPLPNEIPGLDEATESWYQLDGNEQLEPEEVSEQDDENSNTSKEQGGLPFGFNGDSNTNIPNLPFGIGSNAQGVPFDDAGMDKLPSVVVKQESIADEQEVIVQDEDLISIPQPLANQPEAPLIVPAPAVGVPEVHTNPLFKSTVEPQQAIEISMPEPEAVVEAPQITDASDDSEIWTINAATPDMEEIYSTEEQIVEYVHESDEPVIYATNSESHFNPEMNINSQSTAQEFNSPLESIPVDNQSRLILELHPAKALGVDLSEHPNLEELLAEAFYSISIEDWNRAAESFQQLAASKPNDANIFNNYGLSLLQRALAMNQSQKPEIVSQSEIQFRSSILSLREAAKTQPENPTILLNLSHALLASGRTDKALQIIRVHNSTNNSTEGQNLEAAALAAQGKGALAKQMLQAVHNGLNQSSKSHHSDKIISSNLAKFA